MTAKRPYLIAACLWLAMILLFFWPVIFQGKVIAPLDILDSLLRPWATTAQIDVHNAFTYDAISQYLPYDWSVYQSLRQDGYIGWNPYVHSGSSIVENTMICPGDWRHHLYRFLPFWEAWNLGIFLQFLIAGLGMLMLLRGQKIPAAYALIGVVAYGFYSQFTLWICHRWVLGAMCWAPWVLWALLRARDKGKWVDVLSAVFIALAFRGGHLQSVLFVFLLVSITAFHYALPDIARKKPISAFRSLSLFVIAGFLGTILAADVLIETIPALLEGNKSMTERSPLDALMGIPTLVTSIIPTLMGTPNGLDAMKIFDSTLFSIKFMGGIALLLGSLALFNRSAPSLPKTLFVVGLLLTFTPADKWLYSRFTVIFALGGAWLAAWQLHHFTNITKIDKPKWLSWAIGSLAGATAIWLLASSALTIFETPVREKLHAKIQQQLPDNKAGREAWMFRRADEFLARTMIWHPYNLVSIALLGMGLYASSCIAARRGKPELWAYVAAISTFGELFLFSSTWITYSDKPNGQELYDVPDWLGVLKTEVADGKVALYSRADFDYMQLNTPSAYGIRFADGYDTVTPSRITPMPLQDWDAHSFAKVGISHMLVAPGVDPGSIRGWNKVIERKEFILYGNTQFEGLFTATLSSGERIVVRPNDQSPNRMNFSLPAGTEKLSLLTSYNTGWNFKMPGQPWKKVTESIEQGMTVIFDPPIKSGSGEITLQYIPTYRNYYRPLITFTAFSLCGLSVFQFFRGRRQQHLPHL